MQWLQVVFLGSLIGNLIWGTVADKFGRKMVKHYLKFLAFCMCLYILVFFVYMCVFQQSIYNVCKYGTALRQH